MNFSGTLAGSIWADAATNLFIFALGFVVYAALQPAIKRRQWWIVLPFAPLIAHAAVIDVLFNQTGGRLVFMEWRYTLTLSQRIDWHYRAGGWRGARARWWADRVINRILPGHITGRGV
jgi:hypothetical protein